MNWVRFTDHGASTGAVAEAFRHDANPHALFPAKWLWVKAPDEARFGSSFDGDRWDHSNAVDLTPPPQPEPEPDPVFVYKLDLFERTNNAEAEAILAAMDAQPARIRMIFNAAQSFREDHELWPLLTGAAIEMFGVERAGELLAPSS